MLRKGYRQLDYADRLKLEALLNQRISKLRIAEELGCHISTIYRELPRGLYDCYGRDLKPEKRYSADIAQKTHDEKAEKKGASLKIGHDFSFASYVEELILKKGYSPAAVIGELRESGRKFQTSVCPKTLYNYIHQNLFLNLTAKDLPRKGHSKPKHERIRRFNIKKPLNTSIDERPQEVNERTAFGHWEMDTVIGRAKVKGPVLLVLTERVTRREIVEKIAGRTQEAVRKALDRLERSYGKHFKRIFRSITIDNGSEFLDAELLERSCRTKGKRTKVYYCHPYSSWERGSNENANGMIRRRIPKGTSIAPYTAAQISEIQDWLNHYPRKIHDYQCSEKLFQKYLAQLDDG